MIHPLLRQQLAALGLDPSHPPTEAQWSALPQHLSATYPDPATLETPHTTMAASAPSAPPPERPPLAAGTNLLAAETSTLRAITTALGAGICLLDAHERLVSINTIGEQLLGWSQQEIRGERVLDRLLPGVTLGAIRAQLASDAVYRDFDSGFMLPSGRFLPVNLVVSPVREPNVRYATIMVFLDNSQRRAVEQSLRENEARYRSLLALANRQADDSALLDRMRAVIARELDLAALFRTVVEAIATTLGYSQVSIFLLRDGKLILEHCIGYDPGVLSELALHTGVMARVIRTGEPVLIEDVRADPLFIGATDVIVSEICVPLMDDGQIVGVLNVESTDAAALSQADLRLVTALSEHLNIAISRARLYTEVRESVTRFSSLVANVPGAIYRSQPEHPWINLFISGVIKEITGYPAADFIAGRIRTFLTIMHPEDRPGVAAAIERAVTVHRPFVVEYRIRHADGRWRWVHDKGQGYFGADGQLLYLDGVIFDITERKRAEEAMRDSEQKLRAIVEYSTDAIYIKDAHGKYVLINPAGAQLFNMSAEQIMGKTDADLFSPMSARDIAEVDAEIMRSERAVSYARANVYSGVERVFSTIKFPYRAHDGTVLGVIGISRDITDQARAEEALQQGKEAAEAASRAKSSFLANMSHELRTPLNAILGFSQVLEIECKQQGLTDFLPDLHEILVAGHHLLAIISDILDISKIEADKIDLVFEELDVASLVASVASTARPLMERNRNRFEVLLGHNVPPLVSDSTKLRQILLNLMGNAAKFTTEGHITFATTHELQGGLPWIIFRITDTGIGMTPDQQARLFEPFMQVDASSTRPYGGTGLGLAISQRLSRLLGGQITVTSELGHGSTFIIRVPASPPPPPLSLPVRTPAGEHDRASR